MTENVVLSHNRQEIIAEFGEKAYRTGYSCLSTAACSSILYGYLRYGRKQGPIIWRPNTPAGAAALLLQGCGLVGFSQMFPPLSTLKPPAETPAPVAQDAKAAPPKDGARQQGEVAGLHRVSRHPFLWSLGLLGVGTALTTPFAPEIVFFSMPCAFAFIGGAHQDYRHRRGWGGYLTPELEAQTSLLPFGALVAGRQSWERTWSELKQENALAGAGLAVVLALLRLG
eukprot:CAMPEP_0177727666 /NCGR_PEP_ID=MMETSP0484_2-20121128/20447_1 /TAXON_ID=354590 /ORGANISM="Rhodomonas lens, Strain RHODO" /LENGTH=226 /DNA_ID=CAMNT_0019240343 /DNA_START=35 /DNA_END=711 /DNA_ORIENTATION=-